MSEQARRIVAKHARTRKPLELSPRAAREYHAELEHIAADDPQAAGLVFSRVERTLDLIERNPVMGIPARRCSTAILPIFMAMRFYPDRLK